MISSVQFGGKPKQITKEEQAKAAAAARRRREEQEAGQPDTPTPSESSQKIREKVNEDTDALLDEIDAVLAENARHLDLKG